jgi:hypothetical protein
MKTRLIPALAVLIVATACLQARPIYTTYIVPDEYRGPLILILDENNGIELPPPTGAWTIVFGKEGKVTVKADTYRPAHTSTRERTPNYLGPRAQYSSGQSIPMEGTVPDNQIAFRSVYGVGPGVEQGETVGGAVYFYVGTLEEAKLFESNHRKK